MVGAMWRKQNIFQFVERVALRQRLMIENIQRGAFDSSIGKRAGERSFVDHRASADIDHHRRGLHRHEFRLTDHATRFRS